MVDGFSSCDIVATGVKGRVVAFVQPCFFWTAAHLSGLSTANAMGGARLMPTFLKVPFETQHDNSSGTGWRECYSSSAAMLARFWNTVPGDDAYNLIRARYGDTTSAAAQVRALRSLGLRSDFWTNGNRQDIENQIRGGRPVAVGWLHRGSIRAPGGGHWSVIVGLDGTHFSMHDPAGEPLLMSGGHIRGSNGRAVRCSWLNFLPRWEVEGPRTGWYLTCSR